MSTGPDLHEDDPAAGTPPLDGDVGDAGTPSGDEDGAVYEDRATQLERELAEERARNEEREQKWAAEKNALEEARRENEALKAQTQTGYRPQPEQDPRVAQLLDLQETMAEVNRVANDRNDPNRYLAKANLISLQAVDRQLRAAYEQDAIASLPADYQAKTKDFYNQNRHRFASPEDAYWALVGRETVEKSKSAGKDAERNEQVQRRHDAAPAMPATGSEPAAGNGVAKMSRQKYFDLLDQGRVDLIAKKDSGRLILTD